MEFVYNFFYFERVISTSGGWYELLTFGLKAAIRRQNEEYNNLKIDIQGQRKRENETEGISNRSICTAPCQEWWHKFEFNLC